MKNIILVILLVVTLAIGNWVDSKIPSKKEDTSTQIEQPVVISNSQPLSTVRTSEPSAKPIQEEPLPQAYQITNVPFASQAPDANWDELHDEACEEASLAIAYYYISGKNLTPQAMENEIQKMVEWQINNWNGHNDLTVAQTRELAEQYYHLNNLEVKKVVSADDLKKEISQNHLIIAPFAGRELGNPYFRSPGPIYHMLVITGYDLNTFITNDVGTRRGQNFKYNQNILFNALHDWNGTAENIDSGHKNVLVFK